MLTQTLFYLPQLKTPLTTTNPFASYQKDLKAQFLFYSTIFSPIIKFYFISNTLKSSVNPEVLNGSLTLGYCYCFGGYYYSGSSAGFYVFTTTLIIFSILTNFSKDSNATLVCILITYFINNASISLEVKGPWVYF